MLNRKTSNYSRSSEAGFSMIELLIVAAVVVIISTIAVIQYRGVKKGTDDNIAKTKLIELAQMQQTYRVAMGRRRFATLDELRNTQTGSGPLVPSNFFVADSQGNLTLGGGWIITPSGDTSTEALTSSFGYVIKVDNGSRTTSSRNYCIHEDGVLRFVEGSTQSDDGTIWQSPSGKGGATTVQCGRTSTPVSN